MTFLVDEELVWRKGHGFETPVAEGKGPPPLSRNTGRNTRERRRLRAAAEDGRGGGGILEMPGRIQQ